MDVLYLIFLFTSLSGFRCERYINIRTHLLTKNSRIEKKEKNFEFKDFAVEPLNGTLTPLNCHLFPFFDFLYQFQVKPSYQLCYFSIRGFQTMSGDSKTTGDLRSPSLAQKRLPLQVWISLVVCFHIQLSLLSQRLKIYVLSVLYIIFFHVKFENCSNFSQLCNLAREYQEPTDYSSVSLIMSSYL